MCAAVNYEHLLHVVGLQRTHARRLFDRSLFTSDTVQKRFTIDLLRPYRTVFPSVA